jgi:hypothetical protein
MPVPTHAWYYKQPKQWLSNSFSWFNLGNPSALFKTTDTGGLSVCLFRFPAGKFEPPTAVLATQRILLMHAAVRCAALVARQQELADVTKRQQLTPAVQEADGTKKDAEIACAREVCRQLDALVRTHPSLRLLRAYGLPCDLDPTVAGPRLFWLSAGPAAPQETSGLASVAAARPSQPVSFRSPRKPQASEEKATLAGARECGGDPRKANAGRR